VQTRITGMTKLNTKQERKKGYENGKIEQFAIFCSRIGAST